jgi:hypothetical protein
MKKHVDENRYYNEAWISNEGIILKQLTHNDQIKKKLTQNDLIRYDQIDHVGGIRNTLILADQIQFKKDMHVLDVGGVRLQGQGVGFDSGALPRRNKAYPDDRFNKAGYISGCRCSTYTFSGPGLRHDMEPGCF